MTHKPETDRDVLEEYYIQNKNAGYLGNAPTWWAKNAKGYTAYILGAHRFSKQEAEKLVKEDPAKFAMFKCSEVDARLHLVFDGQDFHRLGTDAGCGWPGGYASLPAPTQDTAGVEGFIDKLIAFTNPEMVDLVTKPVVFYKAMKDINEDAVALKAALRREDAGWQPTHRHVRRGSLYEKIGNAQLQVDKPRQFSDYAYMIVYRGEDGSLWVRPVDEFIDGRFEELSTPQDAIKSALEKTDD